jgi:integrase
MTKRSAGEGTIHQLPSGNWRAQVTLQGRRISRTRKSQQAARDWIREVNDQIEQGLTYAAERTTLISYLDAWLENKRSQLRTATIEQYKWARSYLVGEFARVKLKDVTPARVQRFYDRLRSQGKGVRTIQVIHGVLSGCLDQACRLGLIGRNPAAVCIVPRETRTEMHIWTESEVAQFLVFIRGQRNEILYITALATGMRRGELLGLQWKDIDWNGQTINISRQVFEPSNGGYHFQAPKTGRGVRTVRLGGGMVERLREQAGRVDIMRQMARERWKEHDLVFPSMVGTPQGSRSVTREFHHLVEVSGLPVIRLHDCRHTAASLMLGHGIPPIIVAGMLGHSLSMLMTTYAHFIPNMQDEAARLMDQITTPVAVELRAKA